MLNSKLITEPHQILSFRDTLADNIYKSGNSLATFTSGTVNSTVGIFLRLFSMFIGSKEFHINHNIIYKPVGELKNKSEQEILDEVFEFSSKVTNKIIDITTPEGKKTFYKEAIHMGRIWSNFSTGGIWIYENTILEKNIFAKFKERQDIIWDTLTKLNIINNKKTLTPNSIIIKEDKFIGSYDSVYFTLGEKREIFNIIKNNQNGFLKIQASDQDESLFHPIHTKLQVIMGYPLGVSKIDLRKITREKIDSDAVLQVFFGILPFYFVDDQENVPINLPMSKIAQILTAASDPKASGCVPIKSPLNEIIGVNLVTRNEKTPNMQEKYGRSLIAISELIGAINYDTQQNIILKKLFQLAGIRIIEKEVARQYTEKRLISAGGFALELQPKEEYGFNIFADIKNATGISKKLRDQPNKIAFLINSYLDVVVKSALHFGFRIDNIMGDGIFFQYYETFYKYLFKDLNIPNKEEVYALSLYLMIDVFKKLDMLTSGKHPMDKERAFLKILKEINEEFSIRIGISAGDSLIMPLGPSERHNNTAIGHFVNLASRLESGGNPGQIQTHKDFYLGFANCIIDADKKTILNIFNDENYDNPINNQYLIERNYLAKNNKATAQRLLIESFKQWDPEIPDLIDLYKQVTNTDIISVSKKDLQGIGKKIPTVFINWDRKLPVKAYYDTINIFNADISKEDRNNSFRYLLNRIEFFTLAQKAVSMSLKTLGIDQELIIKHYELKNKIKQTTDKFLSKIEDKEKDETFRLIDSYTIK